MRFCGNGKTLSTSHKEAQKASKDQQNLSELFCAFLWHKRLLKQSSPVIDSLVPEPSPQLSRVADTTTG
jgi:hypothetical protein